MVDLIEVELWGGPHDGLTVEIPRGALEIRVRGHVHFNESGAEEVLDLYTWTARHSPGRPVMTRYEWLMPRPQP